MMRHGCKVKPREQGGFACEPLQALKALIKWSPQGECFDFLSNSLNQLFKEMNGYQSGKFICQYIWA